VTRRASAVTSRTKIRSGQAATLAAVTLLAALAACSAPSPATSLARATSPAPAQSKPAHFKPSQGTQAQARPAQPSALPVAAPSAASLPQTSALPRTDDAAFASLEDDLWLAVTTGDAKYALPAFFPEKAYEQVKAIGDPAADWRGRLWYYFTLDTAALRPLIKPDATLTKIVVAASYAQWIPPGACYNKVGYWHLPGARVVYRQGGATHSFGIASLISWRGDWYLMHFGAVIRSGPGGVVDDPELGAGIPGPPGSC
jgi:hypothetical protein